MEALLALREAIVHGGAITEQAETLSAVDANGDTLVLSKAVKTPFKMASGGHFTLEALWMQYLCKDVRFADLLKEYEKRGLSKAGAVTVADRGHVLSYLKGEYDGSDHIDLEFVPATSGVTRPASSTIGAFGGSSVGKSLAIGAEMSAAAASAAVLAAQRQETALRTRVTVLDAPGFKNFSDFVFDFFKRQEMASSSGAAAGAKGGKRGRDGAPAAAGAGVETKKARAVGNPIIVVPNAPTSMITLYNAKALFEEGRYIPPAEARAATSAVLSTVLVNHVSASAGRTGASFVASLPTTYEIIDNVSKLSPADWSRVVAVFAFGPEWQFKGWSLGKPPGTIVRPVDVFSFALGFHLHQDDAAPNPNVVKWPVTLLQINKSKRHLDIVAVNKFWSFLEKYMMSKRQYLLKVVGDEAEEG